MFVAWLWTGCRRWWLRSLWRRWWRLCLWAAQEAAGGGYLDVIEGVHKPAIDALAALGVFEGTECADGMFCPGDEMKR